MPTAAVLREIRRATRPHGVATGQRLALTQRQLDRCVASGALLRPHRNVYVDPAVPSSPTKDLAIAVAAGGPSAAAWGRSAGALWGLVDDFPTTPEIVIPYRRWVKLDGVVVHRSVDLCPEHVMWRQRIRATKPLITALDLGVALGPLDVADSIVEARRLQLFQPDALHATVRRLARPGRTGIRNVRAALDLIMIGGRPADSVLELRFHLGLGHLLPPYEYQWQVRLGGKVYYIDFAYPVVKLAIEVDGYAKRDSIESLDRDDIRQNRIVRDHWTILRFTWHRIVRDPSGVAAEILATLGDLGYPFGR